MADEEKTEAEKLEFAKVCWIVEDVLSLRPDLTEEDASRILDANEERIQEAMIERGWHVIEDAILHWEKV